MNKVKLLSICLMLAYPGVLLPKLYKKPAVKSTFVNRWAFQSLCDFVFDPRKVWPTDEAAAVTFNPKDVRPGDMIFVRDAPQFFKKMHGAIEVPYFIMTHGEYLDRFVPDYFKYLDKKVLGWFTIHPCSETHERVFGIPLGIVQYKDICLDDKRTYFKLFKKLCNGNKDGLLYMNFTEWANPKRTKIRQFFADKPFCKSGSVTHFGPYIRTAGKFKFVISPPGLGPDCYRVWESLLVGTIPVVQHSHLDWLYEGLPVLLINEWEEVTEKFLQEKHKEITAQSYASEKLFMDYWIKYIEKTRKLCFERYHKAVKE